MNPFKKIAVVQFFFCLALAPGVFGQNLYWLEGGTSKIRSADVAALSTQDIYSGLNGAYAIAIGSGAMYWTEPNAQRIRVGYEGNPTAATLFDLSSQAAIPRGVATGGTRIYWTDAGNKKISGANTNGTHPTNILVTGLVSPGSLVIDHAAGKLYWVDNGAGVKSILRCDTTGANVETVVSGLNQVWALSLDTDAGKVYWIDTGADKIQWASTTGALPAPPVDLVTGIDHNARGMVLDAAAQRLYWSDITNNALQRHTISSGTDSILPASYAQGLAVGPLMLLPVEMTAFSASASRNEVTLVWETATEAENYGFEVERRIIGMMEGGDDSQQWIVIGFVSGSGTSPAPRVYSFSDRNLPPGRYAYRLKQIDLSGSHRYTMAVEAEVGRSPLEFRLGANYPNPFNPSTNLEFVIPHNGRVTLKVYNALGQEVATLVDRDLEAGLFHSVAFDASTLPSGPYYARLEFDAMSVTRKLVLMK